MRHNQLYQRSIQVILQNQAASGAYIASPNFPTYAYSWLRDGSFIAHAMDRVGEHGSARAFFRWVDLTLRRCSPKVDCLLAKLDRGQPLDDGDHLHTRYTLQGEEAPDEWSNFQLDGYGTWLWALAEHTRLAGDAALLAEVADSIALTVRYLTALWPAPNNDCWEEHPEQIHPYTLAAIYGGLRAAAGLLPERVAEARATAEAVRCFTMAHGVQGGYLVKSVDSDAPAAPAAVDASLVGALVPYRLVSSDDPIAQATIARIERDLHRPGGGIYRYLADTYYGGGEWTLLTAWLGWHYAEAGQTDRARELVAWVEAQADTDGQLPEQVTAHALAPQYVAQWERRWGPVAKPLLWSHAMYLILSHALDGAKRG